MAIPVSAREQQLANMVLAALDADPAFVREILDDAYTAWAAADKGEIHPMPVDRSRDGRYEIRRESNPPGHVIVDTADNHVERFSIDYKVVKSWVDGYNHATRPRSEDEGTSITFAGEACEGFSDRVGNMKGWCVRVTPLDGGAQWDGVIVDTDQDTTIDGTTWYDAVKLIPADAAGFAVIDAEPVTVRVRDLFVY